MANAINRNHKPISQLVYNNEVWEIKQLVSIKAREAAHFYTHSSTIKMELS